MKPLDINTSKPHLLNTSCAFTWEVITQKFDERTGDYWDERVAVFYDPWKAVQYGTTNFGIDFIVQLSSRKI